MAHAHHHGNGLGIITHVWYARYSSQLLRLVGHHHFWIKDGILYETYCVDDGYQFLYRFPVPGMPDKEHCSEACLTYIEKEYLSF